MNYGYVRVSTQEQCCERQLLSMRKFGIPPENIYADAQSGKDFARPMYRRLVRRLRAGDLLVLHSIDRLGRNYAEILEQWRILTREKQADILVLDMPLLDTRRGKDLLGTLIADLVLQILSFAAESERTNIRKRQAEGIAAAKARGVKFGRPKKERPQQLEKLLAAWQSGALSEAELISLCAVGRSTLYRWKKELS